MSPRFYSFRRREAAQGAHEEHHGTRPQGSKPSMPERIRTGVKDHGIRGFIIRKFDETTSRARTPVNDMPSATNDCPESKPSVATAEGGSSPQTSAEHLMDDAQDEPQPARPTSEAREATWSSVDTSSTLVESDAAAASDIKRFSGTPAANLAIKRLSLQSSRGSGTTRTVKRHSYGSTTRSSIGSYSIGSYSIWSNRMSSSSTSSVGSTSNDLTMVGAATAAARDSRDVKRPKVDGSPFSSQTTLDLNDLTSQRQSLDGSLLGAADAGLLREAISPSAHPINPEIHLPKGPELVESQMQGLMIREPDPENPGKALSIISEACTDASHGANDIPVSPDGYLAPHSPNLHHPAASFSTTSEKVFSPVALMPSTRETSVDIDDGEGDRDDEESLSDMSEETDSSFIERFNATSLGPEMLSEMLALRQEIMSIVETNVLEWMRSCPAGGSNQQPSGSPYSHPTSGSSGSETPGGQKGRGTKRGFNDDQSSNNNSPGGGRGGEDPKRQKTASPPQEAQNPPLACPFVKRHPTHSWPNVCQTGFLSVSRLKEHIYRKHALPIHCKRCFNRFKTEAELDDHSQQEVSCNRTPTPDWMIEHISEDMRKRIKSRKGIQNLSEPVKWNGVYQILFPGQDLPADPYCELGAMDMQKSPEELRQLRQESVLMAKEKLEAVSNLPKDATELIVGIIDDIFQRLGAPTPYSHDATPAASLRLSDPANDTAKAGMQFDAQPHRILQDAFQHLEATSKPSVALATTHKAATPADNVRLNEPADDTAKAGLQFDAQPQGMVSQHDPALLDGINYDESFHDFLSRRDLINNGGLLDNGDYTSYGDFANNEDFDRQFPWGSNHPH